MTQCGWVRLCTTVVMGMTITNYWKLFNIVVKREHYDKFTGIRLLSELITVDCFSNTSTTDTGTPANNMPCFGDIDNKGTVYIYQRLNYSSSSPCNSEIITISDIIIATSTSTIYWPYSFKES